MTTTTTDRYTKDWTVNVSKDTVQLGKLQATTKKALRFTDDVVRSFAVAGALYYLNTGNTQYLNELAQALATKRHTHRSAFMKWAEQELGVAYNPQSKVFRKNKKRDMPVVDDQFIDHLWVNCLSYEGRDDEYDVFKVAQGLGRAIKNAHSKFEEHENKAFASFTAKLETMWEAFEAQQKIEAGKLADMSAYLPKDEVVEPVGASESLSEVAEAANG